MLEEVYEGVEKGVQFAYDRAEDFLVQLIWREELGEECGGFAADRGAVAVWCLFCFWGVGVVLVSSGDYIKVANEGGGGAIVTRCPPPSPP